MLHRLIVGFVVICGALAQIPFQVHPCHGVFRGWTADLNSCQHFWRCEERPPTRGACVHNEFFDVARQECVRANNRRCFICPQTGYTLFSMPRACNQFIRCWNGRPTLHACPQGMAFDGRNGIRNCNWQPGNGVCHNSGWAHVGSNIHLCPAVVGNNGRPLYLRSQGSCSRYFVCSAPSVAMVPGECPDGLRFDIRNGVCDRPTNVPCDEEVCFNVTIS